LHLSYSAGHYNLAFADEFLTFSFVLYNNTPLGLYRIPPVYEIQFITYDRICTASI